MKDEEATFIFTNGNDEDLYVKKEILLKVSKKYTNNKNMYAKELDKAIDLIKEKYESYVTFIVGSFYIYGTVIEKLKEWFKNDKIRKCIL